MITYEPPEQQEVNVGDHVEGIGTVVDPDDFGAPSPVSCWCGDPATVQVHDDRWWVSCSCKGRRHDAKGCPEVGGSEGFETKEEAVMAWNALMAVSRLRIDNQRLLVAFNAEHIVRQNLDIQVGRLQELVEDMLSCIEIRIAFNRPPTMEMYEKFAEQARELGAEVD